MTRRLSAAVLLFFAWSAQAADLVFLNTPEGSARLLHARLRDQFFAVQPYVETQQNLAFCGPASIAAVLNSLDLARPAVDKLYPYTYFTQDNIFTPATQAIKSYAMVATRGMTLAEMSAFLNALGVTATPRYADEMDLAQLRGLITSALVRSDARLIANFDRKLLNEAGRGHQSPIAAYDEASDSVLMLDVAKFKYPPTWVKLAELLEAMRSVDNDSGRSRGLVMVEKAK